MFKNKNQFAKSNIQLRNKKIKPITRLLLLFARIVLYVILLVIILAAVGYAFYATTLYKSGTPQEGYLALTGATVLFGEDLEARDNTTVLIHNGLIIQVEDDDEIDIPSEATVLDLSGYTLMPGLIDMHVHMGSQEREVGQNLGPLSMPKLVIDWMRFFLDHRRALLSHGVTSVRSLGDEYTWIMDLRRQLEDGTLEGPRLFAAGPIFTTLGGHPIATFGADPASDMVRVPATPEEARNAVRDLASGDNKVDLIKVVQDRGSPERRSLEPIVSEILSAIVAEAHEHDLPVIAHWGTLEDLKDVLTAGVDGLEHLEARGALEGWPEEILELLVERAIPLSPTLTVTDVVIPLQVHQQLRQRLKEFHVAGGRVVVGTDAGMPGVFFGASVHRELELLVASGLTPQEALKAATSEAAKALRIDYIGAIVPERAADLVVVDGNPIQEIRDTRNVVMVLRDGRITHN